jgi:hypothetical protein
VSRGANRCEFQNVLFRVDEQGGGKVVERSGCVIMRGPALHFPGGTEGNEEYLVQDSRYPGQDLKSGAPERKAEVPRTRS